METFDDVTFVEHMKAGLSFSPGDLKPWILPNHIDGPLLHFSDGQLHWLSMWERIQFSLGLTDAEKLQQKLRPRLTTELEGYGNQTR